MKTEETFDFSIENLGPCTIPSPIKLSNVLGDYTANYVRDDTYVIANINVFDAKKPIVMDSTNLMEKAGPREKIFFDPSHAKAGICTCGGLCPGLNDVIRAIVRCLNTRYGVKTIKGYQYGFRGFFAESGYEPIELDRYLIDEIHKIGGTYLGTSRGGGQRVGEIVDCIERDGINMLIAGLNAALSWVQKTGIAALYDAEEKNRERLLNLFNKYDFLRIVGNYEASKYVGIVSCLIDGISSDSAGTIFFERGISVRTGLQCAPLAHQFLGTYPAGTIRFSTSYFTSDDDFVELKEALDDIQSEL